MHLLRGGLTAITSALLLVLSSSIRAQAPPVPAFLFSTETATSSRGRSIPRNAVGQSDLAGRTGTVLQELRSLLPAGAEIDALDVEPGGAVVYFSLETNETLITPSLAQVVSRGSVVRYEAATRAFSILWDAQTEGYPAGANLDALAVDDFADAGSALHVSFDRDLLLDPGQMAPSNAFGSSSSPLVRNHDVITVTTSGATGYLIQPTSSQIPDRANLVGLAKVGAGYLVAFDVAMDIPSVDPQRVGTLDCLYWAATKQEAGPLALVPAGAEASLEGGGAFNALVVLPNLMPFDDPELNIQPLFGGWALY